MRKKKLRETVDSSLEISEKVKTDVLETIEYKYKGQRDIDIIIEQPEFTSLCPKTGLPDFGCITIKYRPNTKIIELKSLKFYLLQYRSMGVFYEHAVNLIMDDLVDALAPQLMEVAGNFTARGGITTKVIAVYEEKNDI